jgi:acyl phosphate:glycerol-3-phosphate acyltransferase
MLDFPTLADIGGALAIGYLLGSIPFGVLFTRFGGAPDVRTVGSGNIGATNVLRTGRRGLAAATLIADGLKGAVAVLVGLWWIGGEWPPLAAAAGAVLGHIFPLFLGFKGGKGVATYFGALAGMDLFTASIFAMAWLAIASVSRRSSAGALGATLVTLVTLFSDADPNYDTFIVFCALTVLVWIRHADNISRLVSGREPRFGET